MHDKPLKEITLEPIGLAAPPDCGPSPDDDAPC